MKQTFGNTPEITATLYDEAAHALSNSTYEEVNQALLIASRPDLLMTQPAPQLTPWNGSQFDMNNFLPFMRNVKGLYELPPEERLSLEQSSGIGIGVTTLPRGRERFTLYYASHFNKPAFGRMLALFPELTEVSVTTIANAYTQVEAFDTKPLYGLAVAKMSYHVMSLLVDVSDLSVLDDRGSVDELYLTR